MTLSSIRRMALAVVAAAVCSTAIAPRPAVAAPLERIVLAGGCFWGMEGVFEHLRGVTTVVGYAGGSADTAQYETVSTGTTGHAESVEVTYDPSVVTFDSLLEVYFLVAHDPTELNRQGPDSGTQYRSEIFYTTAAQRSAAVAYIEKLTKERVFDQPIVTLVQPLHGFYPAESYHQHFMDAHPDDPYILINDAPKVRALRAHFPQLIASSE